MKKELEKNYNPKAFEESIYQKWLEKKYFFSDVDKEKEPYTIVMPPPNITGHLHMGHALNGTIQDILIRFKRMQGYNTLWVAGTDHASISTELKLVEQLGEITKEEIGRENFLKRAWEWKEEYGGIIVDQFKKLGLSCDWDKERFTLDEGLSEAVLEVFIRLYNKGYIYRGERLINWCPKCQTTISDAEVNHNENKSYLWYMKYEIVGTSDFLTFATTRPETLLGDTAVAVNPNDSRYKAYIGKTVRVPIINREIPIIADEYVEMEFGTGVVKITPAHDPNDFEIGERHNLPKINIMNDDGTLNSKAGKYQGLDRYEARKKIVEEFKTLNLFVKEESITNSIGVHERCSNTIEPLIKLQWFVKMEEMSKPAIEALKTNELTFVPERFGKIYLGWLENIKDWCISRQLWWGHRIPAYYCNKCNKVFVSKEVPKECDKCGDNSFTQDEDTLDTWFSSALWPFSTLGWPNETEEYKHFFPTNTLVTAYDIIFFWVVRMAFSSLEQTGKLPFKDVLIHGLIRDSEGRKMSKSLGNGVNPLDVIEKYGTDSLRLTIVSGNSPGNDQRFSLEKVESSRNFLNKIWNATRFILMNFDTDNVEVSLEDLTLTDKWILSKINTLSKDATANMESYELGVAVQKICDFVWDEYCDWYIEMVKPRLYNKEDATRNAALWTLKEVLLSSLRLLHPYIPFITEEIFTSIQSSEETIVFSKWPEYKENINFIEEEKDVDLIKLSVKNIRNIRSEMNVIASKKVTITIVSEDERVRNIFESSKGFFKNLAYASEVMIQKDKAGIGKDAIPVVIPNGTIYMPFADLVDIEKELNRLNKEKQKLESEVERVVKKLSNKGFIDKAPAKLILEEEEKQKKYKEMLKQVNTQLSNLLNK